MLPLHFTSLHLYHLPLNPADCLVSFSYEYIALFSMGTLTLITSPQTCTGSILGSIKPLKSCFTLTAFQQATKSKLLHSQSLLARCIKYLYTMANIRAAWIGHFYCQMNSYVWILMWRNEAMTESLVVSLQLIHQHQAGSCGESSLNMWFVTIVMKFCTSRLHYPVNHDNMDTGMKNILEAFQQQQSHPGCI